MPGPAPKYPSERRNRNPKARGEWVNLPLEPLDVPPLPKPAPSGGFNARAKREWEAWWSDPAAHMWNDADRSSVESLVYMVHDWFLDRTAASASQIRQYKDTLGLSPKGKQDRRWRVDHGEVPGAEVKRLRPVRDRPQAIDPNP